MKRPFGNTRLTSLILFFVMFALTVGLSLYTKSLSREKAIFQVILSPDIPAAQAARPATLDLADLGTPKKLVQPRMVSITTGHRGGVINKGSEPLWIGVSTRGFKSEVHIDSHDIDFDPETARFVRELNPRQGWTFSVDLEIPKELYDKEQVDSGFIQIIEYKNDEVLAEVPVNVVHTR